MCRVWIPESNVGGNRGTIAPTGSPTSDVYCGTKLNPPYVCTVNSNRYVVFTQKVVTKYFFKAGILNSSVYFTILTIKNKKSSEYSFHL